MSALSLKEGNFFVSVILSDESLAAFDEVSGVSLRRLDDTVNTETPTTTASIATISE